MKKKLSAIVAVILALSMMFVLTSPVSAAISKDKKLSFNDDGKFKIVQFADTQDDYLPRQALIMFIEKVLDEVKPDLVVFSGDNITGSSPTTVLARQAIKGIITPVAERNIPFTITFGNHDSEGMVSREKQLKMYQSYEQCLAYDDAPEIYGCGSHNLPLYSSDGSKVSFNLWLMDSNRNDEVNGGYDYVHEDQIAWYEAKSSALTSANGGTPVPSILFQHIPVAEIYDLLKEVPAGTEGSKVYAGKSRALELNPELASGTILEWPCPPNSNHGQFDSWLKMGDVVAASFGHDHVNAFIGTLQGIDLVQTPGASYQSYGNSQVRGCRVFEIYEDNSEKYYDSQVIKYTDYYGGADFDKFESYYGTEWPNVLLVSKYVLLAVGGFLAVLPALVRFINWVT